MGDSGGMGSRRPGRLRPLEAWRAMRKLLTDPDDTAQVFRILRALSGRHMERLRRRFRADPRGVFLLRERPNLYRALADRSRLRALPAGTLGRAYAEWMDREGLAGEGLLAASASAAEEPTDDEELRWLGERLRDMHDLWHVVTGYDRDLIGEAALLGFTFAQTRHPGVGFIVFMALTRMRGEAAYARRIVLEALRRGRRADWLPVQHWEAWLELPLDEVRERLRLGPPPRYTEIRSPAGAARAA